MSLLYFVYGKLGHASIASTLFLQQQLYSQTDMLVGGVTGHTVKHTLFICQEVSSTAIEWIPVFVIFNRQTHIFI